MSKAIERLLLVLKYANPDELYDKNKIDIQGLLKEAEEELTEIDSTLKRAKMVINLCYDKDLKPPFTIKDSIIYDIDKLT